MSDIAIEISRTERGDIFDFSIENSDLKTEQGLRTATIISLFTDRRVSEDEVASGQSKRGWFYDVLGESPTDKWGSKLWLLERETEKNTVLTRAVEYVKEALEWMLEDQIAATIEARASFPVSGFLSIEVEIERPNGEKLNYTFDEEWNVERFR